MAQGVNKLVKFMLFFFNFIFFLCGVAIIIGCAFAMTKYQEYSDFTGSIGNVVIIVFISIGAFIFITGFFGCFGAMRENYCMLFTYAAIIFCILLIEIAAGVAAFVLRDDLSNNIDEDMNKLMQKYPKDGDIQKIFDSMQENLDCCGTNNYTDWFGVFGNKTVPASCCIKEDCNNEHIPDKDPGAIIYTDGCAEKLKSTLQDNMMAIIIICIVIGLVEITGIFCSCCLMKSVKNDYEVV